METSTGIHRADRRCGHLCVACGLKAASQPVLCERVERERGDPTDKDVLRVMPLHYGDFVSVVCL